MGRKGCQQGAEVVSGVLRQRYEKTITKSLINFWMKMWFNIPFAEVPSVVSRQPSVCVPPLTAHD